MTLDRTSDLIGLALGIIALMVIVVGWLKWLRPRLRAARREINAGLGAINGRGPVLDPVTGREISPALPGIGQRMESVEVAVTNIAHLLADQKAQDRRIASAHQRLDEHDARIGSLETGRVEQVVTKAESVAAYRAMEAIAKHGDDADI